MQWSREDHRTDVLIIGTGAAGIRAAIEAHQVGAKVILVTKSRAPSGCSMIAMGLIQAATTPGDSPEMHFTDTIKAGNLLNNQRLVRVLVNEAPERVNDLERYGTELVSKDGQRLIFPTAGCTYSRALMAARPYAGGFMDGLVKELKRRGIVSIEDCMITKLLKTDGQVVGAVGFGPIGGRLQVFSARSTILACGGAGQVYSLTTNPPEITGDGYAIAYEAGAQLMDMEMIQFRASIIYPTSLRGQPPPEDGLVTLGGRFYNALGERYMKKYDPVRMERATRDTIAICAHKEIKNGKGTTHGGIYNDLSDVPRDELNRFQKFLAACNAHGIDPGWQPIEWAPGAHYFMGGIRINDRCETNVPGLYAAGEVAAGIHGANRLAANALTETQVFGARSGRFAAQRALQITVQAPDENTVKKETERLTGIMKGGHAGLTYAEIRTNAQSVMTMKAGVARSEDGLQEALVTIQRLKTETNSAIPDGHSFSSLARALETLNLLDVAEVIVKAALLRKESRGAQHREDYPSPDDLWLKNTVLWRERGELMASTMPVVKE